MTTNEVRAIAQTAALPISDPQSLVETTVDVPDPGDGEDPGTSPTPDPEPTDGPLTGSVDQQIEQLLTRAEAAFDAADRALADGDLATYQENVERAQELIGQALDLRTGGSGSGSGDSQG